MKEKLTIVKVGGAVLDNPAKCSDFLDAFAQIRGKKLLVHGGGKMASQLADSLGIEVKMVEGRRITDDEMIEVVIMSYAGINKKLVAQLLCRNVDCVGLTGADGNSMPAKKRPVKEGIDFGWVGDVEKVNSSFFRNLLAKSIVPVMAPLTHDGEGHLLNTNADTIASELAGALSSDFEVSLNFIFDHKGVMEDLKDEHSLIKSINQSDYLRLKKEGVITDGMIPKLDNAFSTIEQGASLVRLLNVSGFSQLNNPEFNEYTTIH
ncbi:acetylglutamate kinase [Ekhidna sp.]|uniref:acetylglutamate kinase n=1 Tax=Ekhidna sp. TaxID=2608089 RepID=UPI0032976C28